MNIKINTSILNDKVLKPISRISEDGIITIGKDHIESISTVKSRGIILYTKYQIESDLEFEVNLNIQDIAKLSSIMNCIKNKDIEMMIEKNHIKYKSDEFKFKYHTAPDGMVVKPKLKKEKLENVEYQTSASLNANIFYDILKAASFIKGDDVKLYFYTQQDSGLYCDITNKNSLSSDLITIRLSEDYDGEEIQKELICDIEYIRKMNIQRDSDVYIYFNNERCMTIFDLIDDTGRIRYILPTLNK